MKCNEGQYYCSYLLDRGGGFHIIAAFFLALNIFIGVASFVSKLLSFNAVKTKHLFLTDLHF